MYKWPVGKARRTEVRGQKSEVRGQKPKVNEYRTPNHPYYRLCQPLGQFACITVLLYLCRMTPVPKNSPRILFFSTIFPPFIEEDEVILSKHYRLEKIIARGAQALFRIPFALLRSDLVYCWFGSVYAAYAVFLSKVLSKKSVIVIGGVDASKDAEINYGIWLNPWKASVLRPAFRKADRLLAVDPSLQQKAARLAGYDGRNILSVPTGYDPVFWREDGEKEQSVLTVASCENMWRFRKKGLDKLFDAARVLPDVSFTVIGFRASFLPQVNAMKPANVKVIAYLRRNELLRHFQRAKVYCQPSYNEGLPNSLCEAMLCGCIPVGTRVGGIPTAIGETGYLVDYRDQLGLVAAIRQALDAPVEMGPKARARIASEFTRERREQSLCRIIDELCC
jgi:glycosyltransferase involved in cell wall biosynthesis